MLHPTNALLRQTLQQSIQRNKRKHENDSTHRVDIYLNPHHPPTTPDAETKSRNSRGYIAPEPAGFTDLFAPNTSSIMSVASSTPGYAERYGGNTAPPHQQQPAAAPAPGAAAAGTGASAKSGGGGVDSGSRGRARRSGGGGLDAMLPPPVPRGGGGGVGRCRGGDRRTSEEGFVDSGEDCGMMASPAGGGEVRLESGGGRSSSLLSSSPGSSSSPGCKRKRAMDMRDAEEETEVVKAAAAAAAAVADEEIKKLKGELAAERTR